MNDYGNTHFWQVPGRRSSGARGTNSRLSSTLFFSVSFFVKFHSEWRTFSCSNRLPTHPRNAITAVRFGRFAGISSRFSGHVRRRIWWMCAFVARSGPLFGAVGTIKNGARKHRWKFGRIWWIRRGNEANLDEMFCGAVRRRSNGNLFRPQTRNFRGRASRRNFSTRSSQVDKITGQRVNSQQFMRIFNISVRLSVDLKQ